MNIVTAGDYQGKGVAFMDMKNGIGIVVSPFKRSATIPLTKETIAKYEKVYEDPIQFIGKRKFRVSVEFRDGKKSLIELEEKFYKIMMNKCF